MWNAKIYYMEVENEAKAIGTMLFQAHKDLEQVYNFKAWSMGYELHY